MKLDQKLSDVALIERYRSGEESACTILLARYANLINRRIQKTHIGGTDADDLRQEAYMGLFNAIRTYDSAKNPSFIAYANLCIGNSLKNLLAAASTQKAKTYRRTVSIDDISGVDLCSKDDKNPEDIFISNEAYEELTKLTDGLLSPFEKDVLFCYLSGCDYNQVAAKLHSSQKSVDNALQRARRKLKAVLNNL